MKKSLLITLFLIWASTKIYSQSIPGISYICKLNNIQQVDSNILQFDVWLQNFSTDTLRLAGLQLGIKFNLNGIKNNGVLSSIMLANSASNLLPTNQQNLNTDIYFSYQQFKSAAQIAFYNLALVLNSDSIRIGTFQIINTVAFTPNSHPNFEWKFSLPYFRTAILGYVNSNPLTINITDSINNSFQVIGNPTLNPFVLPVTLKEFKGSIFSDYDKLTWITSNELNCSSFRLQKSSDGVNFKTIQTVASKSLNGNSLSEISYSVKNYEINEGNNYYRLEQVDIDGKNQIVGEVINLNRDGLEMASIYPNPFENNINVEVFCEKEAILNLQIIDIFGRIILSKSIVGKSQLNNFSISTSNVSSGIYLLKLFKNNSLVLNKELIKN